MPIFRDEKKEEEKKDLGGVPAIQKEEEPPSKFRLNIAVTSTIVRVQ